MKYFLKVLVFILSFLFLSSCEDDNKDGIIDFDILHPKAQYFVISFFKGYEYENIKKYDDAGEGEVMYDVGLSGNVNLKFDSDGTWLSVGRKDGALPDAIIKVFPPSMQEYFGQENLCSAIKSTSRKKYGFAIDLPGDSTLAFDKIGQYLGVDKSDFPEVLPVLASDFLSGYFRGMDISYLILHDNTQNITVVLSGAYSVVFNAEGTWIEVQSDMTGVYLPEAFLNSICEDFYDKMAAENHGFKAFLVKLGIYPGYYFVMLEKDGEIRTGHYAFFEED